MDPQVPSHRSGRKTPRPEGLYGFSNTLPQLNTGALSQAAELHYGDINIGYDALSSSAQDTHPERYSEDLSPYGLPSSSYSSMDPSSWSRSHNNHRQESDIGYASLSRSARNAHDDMSFSPSGSYECPSKSYTNLNPGQTSHTSKHRQPEFRRGYADSFQSARLPLFEPSPGSPSLYDHSISGPQDPPLDSGYSLRSPRYDYPEHEPGHTNQFQSYWQAHPKNYSDTHGSYGFPSPGRQHMNQGVGLSSLARRNYPANLVGPSLSKLTDEKVSSDDLYALYDNPTGPPQEMNSSIYHLARAKQNYSQTMITGSNGTPPSLTDRHHNMRADPGGFSSFPPYQQSSLSDLDSQHSEHLGDQHVEASRESQLSHPSLRSPYAQRPANPHGLCRSHSKRQPAMFRAVPLLTGRDEQACELEEQTPVECNKPLPPRPDSPWPTVGAQLHQFTESEALATIYPKRLIKVNSGNLVQNVQNVQSGRGIAMEVGGPALKEFAELGRSADVVNKAASLYFEPRSTWRSVKSFFKSELSLLQSMERLKSSIALLHCQTIDQSLFRGVEKDAIDSSCHAMYGKFEAMAARLVVVAREMVERKKEDKRRLRDINAFLKLIGQLHYELQRMLNATEIYLGKQLDMWGLILEEFRDARHLLKPEVGMILPGQIVQDEETKRIAQELSGVGPPNSPEQRLPPGAEKYLALNKAYSRSEMPERTLIPLLKADSALDVNLHEVIAESLMRPAPRTIQSSFQQPSQNTARHAAALAQRLSETDIADARIAPNTAHLDWQEIQYGSAGNGMKVLRI